MTERKAYTGDVFWCADFPGLHGNKNKDRYAVVISPKDKLPDPSNGLYLVIPTSCSTLSTYAVKLPNKAEDPNTTSGLPEICFGVCDEFQWVSIHALTAKVGDVAEHWVTALRSQGNRAYLDKKKSKK